MKGNNILQFNEATMIEAVQEYLDKRMTEYAPKVKAIQFHDSWYKVHTTEEI